MKLKWDSVAGRCLASMAFFALVVIAGFTAPMGQGGEWVRGGPFALAPPVLAIGVAIIWRRILVAILLGIFGGALLLANFNPVLAARATVIDFIWATAIEPDNLYLYAFTLTLMGMVGVMIRNGGIDGMVRLVGSLARGRRSTQAVIGGMGLVVFFDDYANSVVIGSSARAISDRAGLSREKLAYIVDSTSAPVASLAIISTWIGIEIGLLGQQMEYLGSIAPSGYGVFMHLIPVRFYCMFALMLVFLVALSGRDFGPMLRAEQRGLEGKPAREGARLLSSPTFQKLRAKEGVPAKAVNGLVPILLVLGSILVMFFVSGARSLGKREVSISSLADWRDCFCAVQNSSQLLATAGILGSLGAIVMTVAQKLLSVRETLSSWLLGARSMLGAVALLVLAMTLRSVTSTQHLDLPGYVLQVLSGAPVMWVPLLVFASAAVIALCTGTSYGTMGILIPVAVPLAAQTGDVSVLILSTSAVLDGAVFGDHCSPISDTTVLSSIASSCDHMDHVRTQMPYATIAMLAAVSAGYVLISVFKSSLLVSYAFGLGLLATVLFVFGRKPGRYL